jgi:hypothetical protein
MKEITFPYHGKSEVNLSICGGGLLPRIEEEEEIDADGNYRVRNRIIKLSGQSVCGKWSNWYSGEGASHDCTANIWYCPHKCAGKDRCVLLDGGW